MSVDIEINEDSSVGMRGYDGEDEDIDIVVYDHTKPTSTVTHELRKLVWGSLHSRYLIWIFGCIQWLMALQISLNPYTHVDGPRFPICVAEDSKCLPNRPLSEFDCSTPYTVYFSSISVPSTFHIPSSLCEPNPIYNSSLSGVILFIGFAIGAFGNGSLSDWFGRRKMIIASMLGVAIFGVASALSSSYIGFLVMRALMGSALAGATISSFLHICELTNRRNRRKVLAYYALSVFIGSVSGSLLGSFINNWRIAIFLSVVPSFPFPAFLICCKFNVESPRYLLAKGQNAAAMSVYRAVAAYNRNGLESKMINFNDTDVNDFVHAVFDEADEDLYDEPDIELLEEEGLSSPTESSMDIQRYSQVIVSESFCYALTTWPSRVWIGLLVFLYSAGSLQYYGVLVDMKAMDNVYAAFEQGTGVDIDEILPYFGQKMKDMASLVYSNSDIVVESSKDSENGIENDATDVVVPFDDGKLPSRNDMGVSGGIRHPGSGPASRQSPDVNDILSLNSHTNGVMSDGRPGSLSDSAIRDAGMGQQYVDRANTEGGVSHVDSAGPSGSLGGDSAAAEATVAHADVAFGDTVAVAATNDQIPLDLDATSEDANAMASRRLQIGGPQGAESVNGRTPPSDAEPMRVSQGGLAAAKAASDPDGGLAAAKAALDSDAPVKPLAVSSLQKADGLSRIPVQADDGIERAEPVDEDGNLDEGGMSGFVNWVKDQAESNYGYLSQMSMADMRQTAIDYYNSHSMQFKGMFDPTHPLYKFYQNIRKFTAANIAASLLNFVFQIFAAWFCGWGLFGRKSVSASWTLWSGILSFAVFVFRLPYNVMMTPQTYSYTSQSILVIARALSAGALLVLNLLIIELMPTQVRGSTIGFVSLIGHAITSLSPLLYRVTDAMVQGSFIPLLGVLCIVSASLSFVYMPDTLSWPMLDTVDDLHTYCYENPMVNAEGGACKYCLLNCLNRTFCRTNVELEGFYRQVLTRRHMKRMALLAILEGRSEVRGVIQSAKKQIKKVKNVVSPSQRRS